MNKRSVGSVTVTMVTDETPLRHLGHLRHLRHIQGYIQGNPGLACRHTNKTTDENDNS